MAGEWKRAAWQYSPIGLSHTPQIFVNALFSFLTGGAGWERASWSGTTIDQHFLRADRFTIALVNDATGTAGNVTITKSGTNITVTGMAGGGTGVAAIGSIKLTGQPSDADSIVLNDGVNPAVTFEFDSNASVTQTGTLRQVVIGANIDLTLDNLVAAINAAGFTLAITGALPTRWRYDGDGLTQHCGIRVRYVSASTRIEISSFVENTSKAALQYETGAAHIAYILYDATVVNDVIMYGGEDGLYIEVGRDGTSQNLSHLAVMSMKVIPEFSGTKDAQIRWTSQGFVCDLFGQLKFSELRDDRFVDNQGSNKNYSGRLRPQSARGTTSLLASTPVTNTAYYLANRDNLYGSYYGATGAPSFWMMVATFGMGFTPIDGRYKISPLMIIQGFNQFFFAGVSNPAAGTTFAANVSGGTMLEPRWFREVPRFAAVDSSLIPFNNITDQVSGKIYRVAQVADGGRATNIAIEYPDSSNIITISATP